jgi:hypothetical protein
LLAALRISVVGPAAHVEPRVSDVAAAANSSDGGRTGANTSGERGKDGSASALAKGASTDTTIATHITGTGTGTGTSTLATDKSPNRFEAEQPAESTAVLGVTTRRQQQQLAVLPPEIWLLVLGFLRRCDWGTMPPPSDDVASTIR